MNAQSRYSRKHLVPAMVTAAVAAIGVAGFLFMHFGPKKDVQDSGISMRTTAVVEEAGATFDSDRPPVPAAHEGNRRHPADGDGLIARPASLGPMASAEAG